jgi:prepilin signal peptidase PulO-like enzyme (type II secretory pathway)
MSAESLQDELTVRPADQPPAEDAADELGFGIRISRGVGWAAIAAAPLLTWLAIHGQPPKPYELAALCLLAAASMALTIFDLRDGILPDSLVALVALGGFAMAWLHASGFGEMGNAALGAACAGGWLLAVRQFYLVVRRVEALGLGDVKLAAAGGAWVGFENIPQFILLAVLISILVAIALRLTNRQVMLSTRIPFGPGLAGAIWVVSANVHSVEVVQKWIS